MNTLQALDSAHHLHPFTDHGAMQAAGGTHVLTDGSGCWLRDQHGRRLLDGLAGLWCVNVGYGRQEITQAVTAQMERLAYYPSFFNSTTEPAIELAARLADLAPARLRHAMFSNSGSEANETALKLVRNYWHLRGEPKRTKILTREFAYHGVTLATASMTGLPSCQTPFDLPLPGFLHAPAPHAYASPQGFAAGRDRAAHAQWCLEETERIIRREGPETIAALFAEPVQGAGGVIVPPPGYMAGLRELARRYGILFVTDEVITGFGRLGAWFASGLWELEPDMMCLAKGLTSGYLPLGATLVADEIADPLMKGGYLAHGFTYSGHPTSCAAALANIALIENERLVERTRDDTGPYFQQKIAGFAGHPAVGEARGLGLIGALELRNGTGTLGIRAAALIREEGVIVRGIRDIVAMAPPLTVTREEIDVLFTAVQRGLERMK
jgi:putrescine aminotransferase